jgi:hypothetical protein
LRLALAVLLATLAALVLTALAWLLALLAGFLLPAALLLLAVFAALLILLATLIRILVRIFVCHVSVSWLAPRAKKRSPRNNVPADENQIAACLLTHRPLP